MRGLLKRTIQISALVLFLSVTGRVAQPLAAEAVSLHVALESPVGANVRQPGEVLEQIESLLTTRGHSVSIVSSGELDTPAEINRFDVVALNGPAFAVDIDWGIFDAQIEPYVSSSGGIVASGWVLWWIQNGQPGTGIEAVHPFSKGYASIFV